MPLQMMHTFWKNLFGNIMGRRSVLLSNTLLWVKPVGTSPAGVGPKKSQAGHRARGHREIPFQERHQCPHNHGKSPGKACAMKC